MAVQSVAQLSSYFNSIIYSIMLQEREPLDRLVQQRDTVNVQRGVITDLRSKLDDLQLSARMLQSSDPLFSLSLARSVSVSNQPADRTVLTATAASSAGTGSYDISVTRLALAQRKASAVQSSSDQALGLTGSLLLGGSGTANASTEGSDILTGAGTGDVSSGIRELATGTYSVETRNSGGVYQFRLKNSDGSVVAIADKNSATTELTSSWQNVSEGAYDTGRGLTLTFAESGTASSTAVEYTAAGVSVEMEAADNLLQIAANINSALQPEGREIQATVVGKQLVFSALRTGTAHTMIFTDQVEGGLGFGEDLQTALDAEFSVSGIAFSRSSNNGLTDVVAGVTLNLAADAEGNSATMQIQPDAAPARSSIDEFLGKMNGLTAYIEQKTSVTKTEDGSKTTYSRGALADESMVYELRTKLFNLSMSNVSSDSAYRSLREIGISITDDLKLAVVDSEKLNNALINNFEDVKSLLDGYMTSVTDTLGRFTGSTGYLTYAIGNLDRDITYKNQDISSMEIRLDERQLYLINQYAELQAQLAQLNAMQSMMSSIYGGMNISM